MNQTRMFLLFAWLMVATFLWMEWGKEQAPPPASPAVAAPADDTVPGVPSSQVPSAGGPSVPAANVPAAPGSAPAMTASPAAPAAAKPLTVETDVLRVRMTGGELDQADLIKYPGTAERDSAPMRLLASDPEHFFIARTGWHSPAGASPESTGFVPDSSIASAGLLRLAPDAKKLVVPFIWNGPNGVSIRRTYTFERGSYVVQVRDDVRNGGAAPWEGYVYRSLSRVPRAIVKSGPMSAESYSFQGAAWYSPDDKYEKCKYDKFGDGCELDRDVTGGWTSMIQHHFFAGWIPQKDQAAHYSLKHANGRYGIDAVGPRFTLPPGATGNTTARLWVGPKLVKDIEAQGVAGLQRAVDFSSFEWAATLAEWLFKLLALLHGLLGNWGWAIVGLVIVIKAAMFPLSAAQYKSMAKMRKFQPRIKQLQERYGDDKQKLQMAMMELYKKEKINPVGGCLPILVQMPVFLCLYWMLSESVELRHAPWALWIHDLTSRDPYFVLPAINLAVMWFTQKLTPMAPGMDPMQQKMMQFMPLVFGVLFAFMPAGLVLYWITNGSLGLLQQWWMTKRYAEHPEKLAD
jgi:YidC/Oxa1 family membrane protein insertase